jgi:hypothetical protein
MLLAIFYFDETSLKMSYLQTHYLCSCFLFFFLFLSVSLSLCLSLSLSLTLTLTLTLIYSLSLSIRLSFPLSYSPSPFLSLFLLYDLFWSYNFIPEIGMYQTPGGFLLSDGRRTLNNSGFQQMSDSPTTTIPACSSTTCQCVYLNTNFNTELSDCTTQKNFLCEFKGI